MDELLPSPGRAGYAPSPDIIKDVPRFRLPSLPRLHPHLPRFGERRSPADPAVFLTLALSVSAAVALGSLYAPAYRVSVDGVDIGLVSSRQAVEAAMDRVESRASEILGYEYVLNHDMGYDYTLSLKEDQIPVSQVETYLFDQIGEVMKTSVLTVNGQMIGAADDWEALDPISMKTPFPPGSWRI